MQLAASLRGAGIPAADPRIIARTGWTTQELFAAIGAASPPVDRNFDFATLLIGVNDQYRGFGVARFARGFEALLALAAAAAADEMHRVVVISIPDWSVTPFAVSDPRGREAIAREIDQFNAYAHAQATQGGAAFVDVTFESRRAATDPTLLAADGLHPSAAMYASWVELLFPVAQRLLSPNEPPLYQFDL